MTTRQLTHWRSLGTAGTIAFSRAALAILAAASCLAPQAQGRVFTLLSYKELLNRSDMVVIATPSSRTRDTNEPCDLPLSLKCTGVETVFDVSAVFKGDKDIRTFTLHHFREVNEVNASGEIMGLGQWAGIRLLRGGRRFLFAVPRARIGRTLRSHWRSDGSGHPGSRQVAVQRSGSAAAIAPSGPEFRGRLSGEFPPLPPAWFSSVARPVPGSCRLDCVLRSWRQ